VLRGFVVLALSGLRPPGPSGPSRGHGGRLDIPAHAPVLGTGISADITTRVGEQSIDVSFSDILESMHFAAMGTFEGRKGRWDSCSTEDTPTSATPFPRRGSAGDVDIKMVQYGFSLAGTVRIIEGKTAWSSSPGRAITT